MATYCGHCGLEVDLEDGNVVLVEKLEPQDPAFGDLNPAPMAVELPTPYHQEHAPRGAQYREVPKPD